MIDSTIYDNSGSHYTWGSTAPVPDTITITTGTTATFTGYVDDLFIGYVVNNVTNTTNTTNSTDYSLIINDYDSNVSSFLGSNIFYDVHSNISDYRVKKPIMVVTDAFSPSQTKLDRRWNAKAMEDNYFVINIDTRGKGSSSGSHVVNAWECLDVYNVVEQVRVDYANYTNDIVFIGSGSGGGGRSMSCAALMPDYFNGFFSIAGISNYTNWYNEISEHRVNMQSWIGGTPSTNLEGYESRGVMSFVDNIMIPAFLNHGTVDGSVPVSNSDNLNVSLVGNSLDVNYVRTSDSHAIAGVNANYVSAGDWLLSFNESYTIGTVGSFVFGGFLLTKNFSVFLNNEDFIGSVDYDLSVDGITFLNISSFGVGREVDVFVDSSSDYFVCVSGDEDLVLNINKD